jgi:hypothetical protein
MKVAELFAVIGLQTDEKKAKDFFNILSNGKGILMGLATMAVGGSLALGAMIDRSLNAALALSQFSAQTGLSAQALQEWQQVGDQLSITSEEVQSSISGVHRALAMVRLGAGNIAPFQMLGIDVNQDVWSVLNQLRQKVRSGMYDRTTLTGLMEQMGLSPSMVKMLQLSNKEFDKMVDRKAIISPEQIQRAEQFNASIRKMGWEIRYTFMEAFMNVAPSLEGFVRVGMKVIKYLGEAWGGFDRLIKTTIGWDRALKGLVMVLGVIMLALNPVYAVMAALIFLLHSYQQTVSGGSFSVIGTFMKTIVDVIGGAVKAFKFIIDVTIGWDRALRALAIAFGVVMVALNPFYALIAGIIFLLADLEKMATGAKGAIENMLPDWWRGTFEKFGGWLFRTLTPEIQTAPGGGGRSVSQTNNINVGVSTNADAVDTAIQTRKEINATINQTSIHQVKLAC